MAGKDQSDGLKTLFDSLVGQYKLVVDRRNTLSGQAAQLMTFAGIIQTILVGLMIALATSETARTLLAANPYAQTIPWVIAIGFAMYLATAITAILSYRETLMMLVPAPIPNCEKQSEDQWKVELDAIHANPSLLWIEGLELQLLTAIKQNTARNKAKYRLLQAGYIFLVIGIVLTGLAGYLILPGIW